MWSGISTISKIFSKVFTSRFGNQVTDDSKCITERCILARIDVYFPTEKKLCSRPEEDRKVDILKVKSALSKTFIGFTIQH